MADAPGAYRPIEDYGIIGDLHTVAVVGMHGSIDFCSFPNFPQAFTHLALISAAFAIDRKLSDAGWIG